MGLKYFNKSEYKSLNDALSDIRRELLSLCPTDTADVKWSRSLEGIKAYTKRMGGASSTPETVQDSVDTQYEGMFALKLKYVDGKPSKIVVCDGATYDAIANKSADSLVSFNHITYAAPYSELDIVYDKLMSVYAVVNVGGNSVRYVSIESSKETSLQCPKLKIGTYHIYSDLTRVDIQQRYEGNDVATIPNQYYGYFTLEMKYDDKGEQLDSLVVCDGATYNNVAASSRQSLCYVNGVPFYAPYTEIDLKAVGGNSPDVCLVFTPYIEGESGAAAEASIKVQVFTQPPADDVSYYILGSLSKSDGYNGHWVVAQRHTGTPSNYSDNGAVYMEYFIVCEQ